MLLMSKYCIRGNFKGRKVCGFCGKLAECSGLRKQCIYSNLMSSENEIAKILSDLPSMKCKSFKNFYVYGVKLVNTSCMVM